MALAGVEGTGGALLGADRALGGGILLAERNGFPLQLGVAMIPWREEGHWGGAASLTLVAEGGWLWEGLGTGKSLAGRGVVRASDCPV